MPARTLPEVQVRQLQALVAEFLGTMCLAMVVVLTGWDPEVAYIGIGLALAVLTYTFNHISGAHFNPAVSLGMTLCGLMSFWTMLLYWVAQLGGAICGAFVSLAIAGPGRARPFTPNPDLHSASPVVGALVVELVFTFAMAFVFLSVMSKNRETPNSYYGLAIGFSYLGGLSATAGISGGALNPAIGSAVDMATLLRDDDDASADAPSGNPALGYTWVYWVGPLVGGALAAALHYWLLRILDDEARARARAEFDAEAMERRYSATTGSFSHASDSTGLGMSSVGAGVGGGAGKGSPEHAASTLPMRVVLMELVGTFVFVLTTAVGSKPLAVGCMMSSLIFAGDHVCGADYNPAITVGVLLRAGVPLREWWKGLVTIIVQVGGGIIASFVGYAVAGKVIYPHPDGGEAAWGAFIFEWLWTTLLILVVCNTTTQTGHLDESEQMRAGHSRSFHGFAIGFIITAGITASGASGSGSGGVFNPALGTGVGLAGMVDKSTSAGATWIYWVAPLLGSVCAASLFKLLHTHQDLKPAEVDEALSVVSEHEESGMMEHVHAMAGAAATQYADTRPPRFSYHSAQGTVNGMEHSGRGASFVDPGPAIASTIPLMPSGGDDDHSLSESDGV